jgi:hypothetical protein
MSENQKIYDKDRMRKEVEKSVHDHKISVVQEVGHHIKLAAQSYNNGKQSAKNRSIACLAIGVTDAIMNFVDPVGSQLPILDREIIQDGEHIIDADDVEVDN